MKHASSGRHGARTTAKRLGVGALSIVFALSQVLGLLGTAVPAAWADTATEPGTVTVTLAAGEHGSLSIAGEDAETDTVQVDKGSKVTVEVSPDDGWFADSVTTFSGDKSKASKVDVEDGRATFKAEADTTVTCAFYENGSNGSAALEAVATKASAKQAKEASDKAYIKANVNASLSGSDKFERRDVLTVTTTTVDSDKVATPTLDGLWADADGDGMGDYADALKSNAVSHAVLYDLDDSSDYLVGRAGSDISGATLADWGASENNADASMRDGFKFDAATGLVYVPKKYTKKNKDGKYKVASSRIQLLYATADKGAENTFPVKVEADNVDGTAAKSGTASVDVSSPDTQIKLARDKAARDSISDATIESVTVNGIEYTRGLDMWTYDEDTGTLDILIAAAGVRSVDVKLANDAEKNIGSWLSSFATKAFAGNVWNIGTWEFQSAPWAGMSFHTAGHNRYTGTTTGATLPAVENPSGGRYEAKTIYQALGTQNVDVSALQSGAWSIERSCTIAAQTVSGVTIPNATSVDLTCGHVGVNPSGQIDPAYNQAVHTDDDYGQTVRIAAVSGDEAIIGVTVPTTFTQAGAGFFKIKWKINKVRYTFSKCSANVSITDGNSEYSVEGAEYDIYRSSDNALVSHIVTDASGNAALDLEPNQAYYAVETKAPAGYTLHEGHIDFMTGNAAGSEQLKDDPGVVRIKVNKKDSATLGDAQVGASLKGAEYSIASLSTPSWGPVTATTDENGYAVIRDVPLGELTVTETKAPEGYKLDTTVHKYTISHDAGTASGVFELEPENDFAENPISFDIEIAKTKGGEDDSWESDNGQGRAAAGVQFQIVSNTTNEVVGTLTTNEAGFASTKDASTCDETSVSEAKTDDATRPWFGSGKRNSGITGAVPYDAAGYTIREVDSTVPEGFDHVDDWTISADDLVDGTTKYYSVIDKTLNSRIQIVKTDAESGSTVPLAGFKFQVLDADGKAMTFADPYDVNGTVDTFTTDGAGQVTIPQRLKSGKYSIKEVSAAAPYTVNGDAVAFEVPKDYKKASPVTVIKVADKQAKGKATITKTCAEDQSALAGAEYDIVAQQDVVSPDGTVRASAGDVVDHVKTGKDGKATTKELYLGTGSAAYAFVETKAPAGHVLDGTPVAFTLSYADDTTAEVTASADQSDTVTRFEVQKTVKDSGMPLAGAKFQIWNADDEISIGDSAGNLAVRADSASDVSVRKAAGTASVKAEGDEGAAFILKASDGSETQLKSDYIDMEPGKYTLLATQDGKGVNGDGDEVEIEAGKAYTAKVSSGLFGAKATLADGGFAMPSVNLSWSADDSAFEARGLSAGTYDVTVSGKGAGSIKIGEAGATYASIRDGKVRRVPVLLKDGKGADEQTTDADGSLEFDHLPAGTYRVAESEAPAGYVESEDVKTFTVADDGRIDGQASGSEQVEDDYTKLRISKRDITDESEIEGAKLTVTDSDGKTVDSWTSTSEDHEIDALAPGKYTLTEERTPNSYDQAESIEFEVKKTGEIQTVTMYDSPISISGEIDKRQEIADPTAKDTEANGDGLNEAETKDSDDGSYSYTIDFHSTSNTWTDEFTVEDDLTAVTDGRAQLTSITTPQAFKDYDGKMNVWYRTDQTPDDFVDESGANQTLSDGHDNPWLADDSNAEVLGEDGRRTDYTGWKLWKADVSATEAEDLKVSDLGLAEGEHVTAIRFEYGRVEAGFTTRDGGWDREGIKDAHDDIASADETAKENGSLSDGPSISIDLEGNGQFTMLGAGIGKLIEENNGTYTYRDGDTTYSLSLNSDGSATAKVTGKDGRETKVELDSSRFKISDETSVTYAPAIVHMKATDGYTADTSLDNYARVDLYRNGGGDGLEGHDEDKVTQTAKTVTPPATNLDQTGRNVIVGLAAALAAAAAAAGTLIYRRRHAYPDPTGDDDPADDYPNDGYSTGGDEGYGRYDGRRDCTRRDGYGRDPYGYDDRYRDEYRDRY